MTMTQTIEPAAAAPLGLLYGVPAIAEFVFGAVTDKRIRQARHLIDTKRIPTFKLGKTICANRYRIVEALAELEVA